MDDVWSVKPSGSQKSKWFVDGNLFFFFLLDTRIFAANTIVFHLSLTLTSAFFFNLCFPFSFFFFKYLSNTFSSAFFMKSDISGRLSCQKLLYPKIGSTCCYENVVFRRSIQLLSWQPVVPRFRRAFTNVPRGVLWAQWTYGVFCNIRFNSITFTILGCRRCFFDYKCNDQSG